MSQQYFDNIISWFHPLRIKTRWIHLCGSTCVWYCKQFQSSVLYSLCVLMAIDKNTLLKSWAPFIRLKISGNSKRGQPREVYPNFRKHFTENSRSFWAFGWVVGISKIHQLSVFPKTFVRNFQTVCPYIESSGISGRTENALCLKSASERQFCSFIPFSVKPADKHDTFFMSSLSSC